MTTNFKLALIQLAVSTSKADNLFRAGKLIKEASEKGAKVIALPECFNSPYGLKYFPEYAEHIPDGPSSEILSKCAKENKVYLIGGSIPELGDEEQSEKNKLFNTCTVWGPTGALIGKHRKTHLFDINIPGKITFQESQVLSPGNQLTVIHTEFCKIGIGICYDMRFPEMAQVYARKGCEVLVYPGAFNMTTGPAHWQILQQGRAVDNQVYMATCAPARDEGADYVAWGHSMVVSPWGNILAEADAQESVIYADIDLDQLKEIRNQIPISVQRRDELYQVEDESEESKKKTMN